MKRIFVLDACAVIALVKKERGADIVAGLYQRAASGSVQLCINRVNLLEVYYGFYYDKGRDYASNIIQHVESSSVFVSEFDRDVFLEAGRLKASYRLSLADSILVAQAIVTNGAIITADHHELDAIESSESLDFIWIR